MKMLLVLLLLATPLHAQQPSVAQTYFRDVKLVDQSGTTVDVYELMKGRTVVLNSFFATCPGSCPVMSRTFLALQAHFGDRLGKDLVLVSITVDPETDTPAALQLFAEKVKARPGWYFLSGSKEQVERALRKIGQYTEIREGHQNVFIIGNERTGLWKKAFGLAKPDDIVGIVKSVLEDAP